VSAEGSSSSDAAVRIEAYLDDRPEAVQVLTAPPFRFQLDTASLEEGEHTLRLVRIDAAGRRRERRIPFTVEHQPGLVVRGLEPGATVTGRVDVDVVTPRPAAPPPTVSTAKGPPAWLYVLSTVLILGGIWVFFMLVPMYSAIVSKPASSATASSGASASAPPVDQQLLKTGEQLYGSDCAACHKPSGEGNPPTFPALAGNSFLSDPTAVVKRVYDGAGAMPSHHSYTATQLAAVATYIRNTWGNSYGGVSVDVASKAVPAASKGSGASSTSGTGSSSGSSSGSSASGSSTPASSSSSSSSSSSTSSSTSQAGASSATTASSDAMQAGKKLYTSECQGCHQPNGAGMPPTFPALAGNDFLSNASAVMQRIFDGKGAMPSHHSFTAKELADVATYIRNSFGNDYGPVSVDQAKQAVPKAAQ
jgi:cytochrome c oxidase subunit II